MGIPVRFEADAEALLDSAVQAFSAWMHAPQDEDASPLTVRLRLGPGVEEVGQEPRISLDGPVLRVVGRSVRAEARVDARIARSSVPHDLSEDPARLAATLLDTIVLFLVTRCGRIPLHAAGLLVGDQALLLAGSSGSGKSTLALAAHERGIPVLSEDTVYIQLEPTVRVWGFPRPIHLLSPPAQRAPAAPVDGSFRLRGGRWKVAVPAERSWPEGPVAEQAQLCLLEHGGRVSLRPTTAEHARERLLGCLEPGFDHFADVLPRAVEELTRRGAWILTLSEDPDEAIALLQDRFS